MHGLIAPTVFDLVGRIATLHSLAEIWKTYLHAAERVGLPYGILFTTTGTQLRRENLEAATMPSGWLAHYERQNYGAICPLTARARTAPRPFAWQAHDWDEGAGPRLRQWRDDTIAAGIAAGIGVPWTGEGAGRALLMGGAEGALHPHDRHTLYFAGMTALQRLQELAAPPPPQPHLSERECECLKWVAMGKSDWEIGAILAISEKTVNVYIERAKHKLNSNTRIQAVVQALQSGQIAV